MITTRDAPLGTTIGNAREVIESIDVLKGNGPDDTTELSVALATRMLVLAGVEGNEGTAARKVREALASGAGLEVFRRIVENQGGDPRVLDDYSRLPSAPMAHTVRAPGDGHLVLHAELVGRAAVALGAGRARLEDRIDPSVGIEVVARHGTAVRAGDPVLVLRHRGGGRLQDALRLLERGVRISDAPPEARPLILETIAHD
jgi:thymidine phosphorylase